MIYSNSNSIDLLVFALALGLHDDKKKVNHPDVDFSNSFLDKGTSIKMFPLKALHQSP